MDKKVKLSDLKEIYHVIQEELEWSGRMMEMYNQNRDASNEAYEKSKKARKEWQCKIKELELPEHAERMLFHVAESMYFLDLVRFIRCCELCRIEVDYEN